MTFSVTKQVDVEVDIDIDDIIDDMSEAEKNELHAKLSGRGGVEFGSGTGDQARIENIIERAYCAARSMPSVPREIADLFWHVHGRALA